ncbi:MAG: hypothetical protein V9E96_10530 [Chitinophagaceae bacterium]
MLAEDHDDFAPIVSLTGDHDSRAHAPRDAQPPAGAGADRSGRVLDANHVALDPQAHFTVQLRSGHHDVAQFPATFDQRFMDYARVWSDGSLEAISVSDPARTTVAFTDPWSGVTFRALHVGTAQGEAGADVGASSLVHPGTMAVANEAGIGARMLLHAADIDALRTQALARGEAAQAAAYETEERRYLDLVQVMRRLTAIYGSGHIVTR